MGAMLRPLLFTGIVAAAGAISGPAAAGGDPPRLVSYDEMKQAYGRLLGDLFFVGDVTGKCAAQHQALKAAADGAFAGWTERNRVVASLREALYQRARSEGGEDEVERLSRLIAQAGRRVAGATSRHATIGRAGCTAALDRIRQGEHDVQHKYPREVALLLAGRDGAPRNGS